MNRTEQNSKLEYITLIKVVAIILVAWGHLITVCMYALEIPGVINGVLSNPILPKTTHNLGDIEGFFYGKFHIEFGIVGVVLFFLVSGYFIPHMQQKYNCKYVQKESATVLPHLLFVRLKKFYPMMFLCVLLNGVLVYLGQGIVYSPQEYVVTILLAGRLIPVTYTMGVTWFLFVLVFVYFIGTVVPKFSLTNLTAIYGALIVCVLLPRILGETSITWMAWNLEGLAYYSGIPLLGAVFALAKNLKSKIERVAVVCYYFILTFILVKLDEVLYNHISTYSEINTYLAAFFIIFTICVVNHFFPKIIRFLTPIINRVEEISFAFYLLHVHFGILTIYYLSKLGMNAYISVLCGVVVSVLAAYVVTKIEQWIEHANWYKKIGENWK